MIRHAVTGGFGFSGRHIVARLLDRGDEVLNLTNHPRRPHPFGNSVPVVPLAFADPPVLTRSLHHVDTLFNTYWIRFAHGEVTHADAVRNSSTLFAAARDAGVRRIVHISIANPDRSSRLPYYRGKAEVEAVLAATGIGHAILRPAVLFGDAPILVNTIAWLLRRVPLFGVPGDGCYGIQPVSVADMASLALEAAAHHDDVIWDAAGPEVYPFIDFVRAIRAAVGSRALLVRVPPRAALVAARALGVILRDTLLTAEEISGLTAGLLVSHEPPRATTRFSDWLVGAGSWLGRAYLPEVVHHFASGTRS